MDFAPIQGAKKLQVNAEEMLAELKRLLETSTSARSIPPPSASISSNSSSWAGRVGDRKMTKGATIPLKRPLETQSDSRLILKSRPGSVPEAEGDSRRARIGGRHHDLRERCSHE
jgi:hypothetical protein